MKWQDFKYDGITYDLRHLHPRTFRFSRPAENNKPAEIYKVEVIFSSHCFTRGPKTDAYDASLVYPDTYEVRLFDIRRYEMSKRLPDIIQALPESKPRHNRNRRNFFSVELIAENGISVEYDIFFKVRKIAKGRLQMIVETAFIRDPDHNSNRPEGKPVRFWIILHNTLNNLAIRS